MAALVPSPALLIPGPGAITTTINYATFKINLPVMQGRWAWRRFDGLACFGISVVLKSINVNVFALIDIVVSPIVASTLGVLFFA